MQRDFSSTVLLMLSSDQKLISLFSDSELNCISVSFVNFEIVLYRFMSYIYARFALYLEQDVEIPTQVIQSTKVNQRFVWENLFLGGRPYLEKYWRRQRITANVPLYVNTFFALQLLLLGDEENLS